MVLLQLHTSEELTASASAEERALFEQRQKNQSAIQAEAAKEKHRLEREKAANIRKEIKQRTREAKNTQFLEKVRTAHQSSVERVELRQRLEASASGHSAALSGLSVAIKVLGAKVVRRITHDDPVDNLLQNPLNRATGSIDVPD